MLRDLRVAFISGPRTIRHQSAWRFLKGVDRHIRKHMSPHSHEERQQLDFLLSVTPMDPDRKHFLFWSTVLRYYFQNIDRLFGLNIGRSSAIHGNIIHEGPAVLFPKLDSIVLTHLILLIAYFLKFPNSLEFESNGENNWRINLKKVPWSFRRIIRSVTFVNSYFHFHFVDYCSVTNKFLLQ